MSILSDTALTALLEDDVPFGDLTTETLAIGQHGARLEFHARLPMTVCASEEATRMFELAGASARRVADSGTRADVGDLILDVEGSAASLHRVWKAAQVMVEWASGIATATAAIVAAANGVAVACTRKNAPGTKALSAKAVKSGGGIMHRLGLSESLLIFLEHRLFLDETPAQTIQRLRRAQPEKKIVVEVFRAEDARNWAKAGVDVLQMEKFTPEALAACRATFGDGPRPLLAATGGIHAENAAAYVRAGADMLVTSAPYNAAPRDVKVSFQAKI